MATTAQVNILLAMRSRMQGLSNTIGGVAKLAGGLLALGGAYAGFSTAVGDSRAVIKLGADLEHLKFRSKEAVSDLLTLKQAFSDNGASAGAVDITLDRLTRRTQIATQGNNSYAKALEAVGLKADELTKLSKFERFKVVADALSNTADESIRTQAAMDLLDTSAGQLFALFEDFPAAFADARASLGQLPDVLQRNATLFERIDTLLDRTPNKTKQLFAGILDQVGFYLKGPLETLNTLDFTPLGQNIGAAFRLGFQAWEDGTFLELIELTYRAAGELAVEGIRIAWDTALEYVTTPRPWLAVLRVAISVLAELGEFLLDVITSPAPYLEATFVYMASKTKALFQNAFEFLKTGLAGAANFLADRLESDINLVVRGLNKIFSFLGQAELETIKLGRVEYEAAKYVSTPFDAALAAAQKGYEQRKAERHRLGAEGLEATLELLGAEKQLTDEHGRQLTAVETLAAKIREMKDLRDAEGDDPGSLAPQPDAATDPEQPDPFGLNAAQANAIDLAATMQGTVGGALDVLTGKAYGWQSVLSTTVDSVWNPIRDAIAQTTTDLFRQHVLKQQLDNAEKANWLTNLFAKKSAASAVKAADTAENVAKGAADAAAYAPAAAAASAASFGLAPILGLAALAALVAFAATGFADGGYTGPGAKYQPAGIVHAGEYVLPQETVRAVGIARLDHLKDFGTLPGYSSGGYVAPVPTTPTAPAAAGQTAIAFFDSRRSAEEYAATADFEVAIVDIAKRNFDQIFGG